MTGTTVADAAVRSGDPPGWYCFSLRPALAEWDGVAWTGTAHSTAAGPFLPGSRGAFSFVRQPWFRWMVVGQALVILPAILSGTTGSAAWSGLSVIGYLAVMAGAVMVVDRFLELDRVVGLRSLTWIGIGSGVAAFGVGLGLELLVDHLFGWATTLWLTGPIEEGAKLLVPLLLLVVGARKFAHPGIGLYLVLVCGATVGVIEGVEYQVRPDFAWAHLQMAMLRPSAELLHVFVTGFAAAVIWLAAWRRGHALTAAGIVAFVIAAGIHSFHDGIITFFDVRPQSIDASLAQTLRQAIQRGLAGAAFALGLAALFYLLARHGARELTAPGDIAHCPPSWRPQIKQWGSHPPPVPVVPTAPWPATVATWPATVATWTAGAPGFGGAPASFAAPGTSGAPVPVPSLGTPATLPPPPAAVPPPPGPRVVPPGWYLVGVDPGLRGWWTGATWTYLHRWDGFRWVPM